MGSYHTWSGVCPVRGSCTCVAERASTIRARSVCAQRVTLSVLSILSTKSEMATHLNLFLEAPFFAQSRSVSLRIRTQCEFIRKKLEKVDQNRLTNAWTALRSGTHPQLRRRNSCGKNRYSLRESSDHTRECGQHRRLHHRGRLQLKDQSKSCILPPSTFLRS